MIYFVCYLHSLSYLWISTPPPQPFFHCTRPPSVLPPTSVTPRLSCISVFLSGLACVEPAACVVALVCQRWNGCGWQASGRQRETGAEEAWLTDGSADTLRAWEEMRGGGSCSTTAPPLSPPPACSPYISLSRPSVAAPTLAATCCRLRDFVCSPSHFTLLASLSLSSPSPHHIHFLLPCVLCDMNAAAAPFLVLVLDLPSASPSPSPPTPLLLWWIPDYSPRMGRRRRITCSLLARIPQDRNVPL